jgi:hypothetical protein
MYIYIKDKKDISNAFLGSFDSIEIATKNLATTINDCIVLHTEIDEKIKELYYSSKYDEMSNYSLVLYQKEQAKQQRNQLLKKGTKSQDGKMWFNFDSASMFIQAVSTLEGGETLPWYDANREKVELTLDEAKAYAKEIRLDMQKVYGLID